MPPHRHLHQPLLKGTNTPFREKRKKEKKRKRTRDIENKRVDGLTVYQKQETFPPLSNPSKIQTGKREEEKEDILRHTTCTHSYIRKGRERKENKIG